MLSRVLIFILKAYQWTMSPFLGSNCRFYPSCSQYSQEAVRQHGAQRGLYMTLKRLGKCHPYHPGGYDPVDPVSSETCPRPHTVEKT